MYECTTIDANVLICSSQALVEDIDQNFPLGRFNWSKLQVNDAAALLKRFLRQLPMPLLTSELLGAFRKVLDLDEREKQLEVSPSVT